MIKRVIPVLMIFLAATSAAHAQGGHHGGGAGGGRGGGRGGQSESHPPAAPAAKPFTQPEIVGVVKLIDAAGGRVTIAYEPVEALNWPAGTQPFGVGKTALLKDLTVGEKVRFRLESQQIVAIRPF
jgi:Cu/Ag efflux protein CusF